MRYNLFNLYMFSNYYNLKQIEFFDYFSEGTRRDNVEKNIGKRIYAFNSVQRSTLPAQYQPPVGTFGKTKS